MEPDPERLRALGRVAHNGVLAETCTLQLMAGFMLADPRRILPAVGHMGWVQLLGAIRNYQFVLDPHPELQAKVQAWLKEADRCREDRNRAIHSPYAVDDESGVGQALQVSRAGRMQIVDQSTADLDAIADRLEALVGVFMVLVVALTGTGLWRNEGIIYRSG